MNVLFVAPLPPPLTGQALASRALLDALDGDTTVVNLSKSGFRQGISSLGRVGEVLRIVSQVFRRSRSADVIYLTISESFAGNCKDLVIYASCAGVLDKIVVHLHGGAGLQVILSRPHSPIRWLNQFFFRRLGGFVVLGETHAKMLRSTVAEGRLHVVPNFAGESLFTAPTAIEAKFSERGALRILFLSNLLPGKGHEELVRAYRVLDSATQRQVRIDFAGGFEDVAQERAFLAAIQTMPNLTYHGVVDGERKKNLFANAHVFCLPTYYPYEGQPISILEAYASGCAVITTNHSGIGDVFRDGVNGYQVIVRSVPSLAAAIGKAVGDRQRLWRFAEVNHAAATERYRVGQYCQALTDILRRTAAAN